MLSPPDGVFWNGIWGWGEKMWPTASGVSSEDNNGKGFFERRF